MNTQHISCSFINHSDIAFAFSQFIEIQTLIQDNFKKTIQITSYSRNNRTVTSSVSSRITYLEEHRRDLKIGLEYWSEPFTVYIGFYPSKFHREEKLCEEK